MAHLAPRHLLIIAEPEDQRRLLSVSCPHALAWTLGPGCARPLSNPEFCAGLHWVLGLDVQTEETVCPCGAKSDKKGRHLANCKVFDSRTRRHNECRDTVAEVVRSAGMALLLG